MYPCFPSVFITISRDPEKDKNGWHSLGVKGNEFMKMGKKSSGIAILEKTWEEKRKHFPF